MRDKVEATYEPHKLGTRVQFPLSLLVIWRVAVIVSEHIANVSNLKSCVGANPILSASNKYGKVA